MSRTYRLHCTYLRQLDFSSFEHFFWKTSKFFSAFMYIFINLTLFCFHFFNVLILSARILFPLLILTVLYRKTLLTLVSIIYSEYVSFKHCFSGTASSSYRKNPFELSRALFYMRLLFSDEY